MLRVWKLFISPCLGQHCKFCPTCSVYAIEALESNGLILGCWLTLRRLCRCNPWSSGGDDPVPCRKSFKQ